MANDQDTPEEENKAKDISSDSGLGNLPPLSDFDSQGGLGSDGGLPPLGSFDTQDDSELGTPADTSGTPSAGGLPPISDIDVDTPTPASGGASPFESNVEDTFSGGASSGGFQDLAADSDFSPETPEIGPGPESNVDTPLFDSAFGGDSGNSGFDAAVDTPAPTQAMETPMFGGTDAPGGASSGGGFGDAGGFGDTSGGFGGGDTGGFGGDTSGGGFDVSGGFSQGTPAPDFSPDTDMNQAALGAATGADGGKGKKKRGGGGGGGSGALVAAAVIALVIGMAVGPRVVGFIPGVGGMLNPAVGEVEKAQKETADWQKKFQDQQRNMKDLPADLSQEKIDEMIAQAAQLAGDITNSENQLASINTERETARADLESLEVDLADLTDQAVTAQEQFEDLQNETAIVQARQKGLIAEVDRLTTYVGQLDAANERRLASKDSLQSAVDRLYIQVKEGIPLTPEKYARGKRIGAVEALRNQVNASNWVSPELMDTYTSIYVKELEIAQANSYFFANLTVTDEFGHKTSKWSECLMQGNWAVYYRSLDGKNIGVYRNLGASDTPIWGYDEGLPAKARAELEEMIIATRVEGWEEKVAALAERQLATEDGSKFQQAFSSL